MKLQTFNNLSKWLRSSKSKDSWKIGSTVQVDYALGQNQTLERVENDINGNSDFQNDWVNISLENLLFEKDYNVNGGNIIKLSKPIGSEKNLFLNSVVDNLVGEKLYGIDIYKKFTFKDNDIQCLTYKQTVLQSIGILAALNRGDDPSNLLFGKKTVVGGTLSNFYYSSLTRQLKETFEVDDTLSDFNLKRYYYESGDLYIDYEINTFFNKIENLNSRIQ